MRGGGFDRSVSRDARARGRRAIFVDACKHRSGNAHPRWLEESADEDGETTNEIVAKLENEEEDEEDETVSPEAVVAKVCRERVERLVKAGACDAALAASSSASGGKSHGASRERSRRVVRGARA